MEHIEHNKSTVVETHKLDKIKKDGYKQIAGAIIITGILVAGAILLRGQNPTNNGQLANGGVDLKSIKLKPVSADEHIQGDPKAKIIIVEYVDLECPFCKVFDTNMKEVIEKEGDKIALVYRHFPLDCVDAPDPTQCRTLHQRARPEAEASECAYEQGGNDIFWKYTDEIFTITKSNDGLDPAEISKIAESLSLDMNQFNSCVDSRKYQSKISNDVKGGQEAGVQGTPKAFILKKGKIVDTIDGALPATAIIEKIENALK